MIPYIVYKEKQRSITKNQKESYENIVNPLLRNVVKWSDTL